CAGRWFVVSVEELVVEDVQRLLVDHQQMREPIGVIFLAFFGDLFQFSAVIDTVVGADLGVPNLIARAFGGQVFLEFVDWCFVLFLDRVIGVEPPVGRVAGREIFLIFFLVGHLVGAIEKVADDDGAGFFGFAKRVRGVGEVGCGHGREVRRVVGLV